MLSQFVESVFNKYYLLYIIRVKRDIKGGYICI